MEAKMHVTELHEKFNKLNLIKEKNSMERLEFCWKLIESDEDEYLDLHVELLDKANKHFCKDLQVQFEFRKDKEKVFTYLQNKLQQNISSKLKTLIPEIIKKINFKTLEEYENWIKEIKSGKRKDSNEFVWAIMKSPFIEFHYELMKDRELSEEFRQSLRARFKEHKEEGEEFLLKKLDNNEDPNFHGEIIFILAQIDGIQKDKILAYARKLTKNKDNYTRNRAIIVLGWIGQSNDYEILEKHLLHDCDKDCRAWSATSFYIIYDEIKNDNFKTKALKLFLQALETENDYFVLAMIIYSVQQLTNKKFGLSQKAIDELDKSKIDITLEKIKRYLKNIKV